MNEYLAIAVVFALVTFGLIIGLYLGRKPRVIKNIKPKKEISVLEIRTTDKVVFWFKEALPSDTHKMIANTFGGEGSCKVISGVKFPDGMVITK
jgi:hypothetical protein